MQTYRYEPIPTGRLTATDLRQAAAGCDAARVVVEAYRITVFESDGRPLPQAAEALYIPGDRRLGIAWGADATWADMTLEHGIETWLNDPDEWEARN